MAVRLIGGGEGDCGQCTAGIEELLLVIDVARLFEPAEDDMLKAGIRATRQWVDGAAVGGCEE